MSNSRSTKAHVYAIDFTAVASGKRIASTKRKLRWRVGFTNMDALANGETGSDCRGEEHDITFIWSVYTGKRLVLADGQEVHYSVQKGNIFEFSWTMRGNHVLKIVAHANPPVGRNSQITYRQYDFFIDGQSYFRMIKMHRLGLNPDDAGIPDKEYSMAMSSRAGGAQLHVRYDSKVTGSAKKGYITDLETPHNADEEDAYLAEAIKNSMEDQDETKAIEPEQPVVRREMNQGNDLLDFTSGPAPSVLALPPSEAATAGLFPGPRMVQPVTIPVVSQPVLTSPPPMEPIAPPMVPSTGSAPMVPPMVAPTAPPPVYSLSQPSPYTQAPIPALANSLQGGPTYTAAPVSALPHNLSHQLVQTQPTASNMYALPVVNPPAPASMSFTSSATTTAPIACAPFNGSTVDTSAAGLGTDAKSAYEKLATMDPLGLVDKPPANRANPFENTFTAAAPAPTLAGIKAMSQTIEKKHVMQVSPENTSTSNALIMTGNQNNNWGLNNNLTQTGTTNQPLPYPGTLQNQALGTSTFQTSNTNQPLPYPGTLQNQALGTAAVTTQPGYNQQQYQQQYTSQQGQSNGQQQSNTQAGYGQTQHQQQ